MQNTGPVPSAEKALDPDPPVATSRAVLGGVLMGLANLVPGISGGTMILALGLYDRFIGAVADVTRLRVRREHVLFLGAVAAGLVLAILLASGLAVRLVAEHRWAMYALFIGMTLGGAPELLRESRPLRPSVAIAFALGLGFMAWFALRSGETRLEPTPVTLVIVGAAAAASMILPGVSGSYILLILGMYDVVVGSLSISEVRAAPMDSLRIVGPVVVGALLGIALLSNLLKGLLRRFGPESHGALLGLLVGSVIGLYPFQESVHPELVHRPTRKAIEAVVLDGGAPAEAAGDVEGLDVETLEGYAVTWAEADKAALKRASLETRRFGPDAWLIARAVGLFALGFALTRAVGRRSGG